MVCSLSGIVNRPLALSMDYCKKIPSYMYIIIYTYYALKIVSPFYNGLLIETCLYITNDLLYFFLLFTKTVVLPTHMSVIRFTIFLSLNIFCIILFLYIIFCIIFIHLIFICSGACFVTFSLLHVYLQRKTTLSVCTCSWILMMFYTVCMVYFYNLIIACVFLCILTCTATCTFNKFCYFLSTHQTNVNKFPNSFFFISYLHQLSSVNVYILIGKIKCIHTITVTTIYPFYILRKLEFI